jgi:hypothetical protein
MIIKLIVKVCAEFFARHMPQLTRAKPAGINSTNSAGPNSAAEMTWAVAGPEV